MIVRSIGDRLWPQRAILWHLEQIEGGIEYLLGDFLNEFVEDPILIDTRLGQTSLIYKTNPDRVFPDRRRSVMQRFKGILKAEMPISGERSFKR